MGAANAEKIQSEQRQLVTDRMRGKSADRQINRLVEKTIDLAGALIG